MSTLNLTYTKINKHKKLYKLHKKKTSRGSPQIHKKLRGPRQIEKEFWAQLIKIGINYFSVTNSVFINISSIFVDLLIDYLKNAYRTFLVNDSINTIS